MAPFRGPHLEGPIGPSINLSVAAKFGPFFFEKGQTSNDPLPFRGSLVGQRLARSLELSRNQLFVCYQSFFYFLLAYFNSID